MSQYYGGSRDTSGTSSQRPSGQRQSGPGRPHDAPSNSHAGSQSPPIQCQEYDAGDRFDSADIGTTDYQRSSAHVPQQAGQNTDPLSRSRDTADVHQTPHVTQQYDNLRQQFTAAEPGIGSSRNSRRYSDQPVGNDPADQSYPPVAYPRRSSQEPEQRYIRSSTIQDVPSDRQSEAQRPMRTGSQRQTAQANLGWLSTAATAGAKPTADEPDDTIQPVKDPNDEPVTLEVFRALIGIPQKGSGALPLDSTRRAAAGDTPATPKTPYDKLSAAQVSQPAEVQHPRRWRRFLFRILTFGLRHEEKDDELATSIYYSVLRQQKTNHRLYVLYDLLTYACMLLQLIIAAVLIIVGALKGDYHIPVAVLGGVTGVLTGILSLVKGQGFPNRFIQYFDSLRRLREDIEFTERELRAGRRIVTYGEVVRLKDLYELVREDESNNRPDVWSTGLTAKIGTGNVGKPVSANNPISRSKAAGSMV